MSCLGVLSRGWGWSVQTAVCKEQWHDGGSSVGKYNRPLWKTIYRKINKVWIDKYDSQLRKRPIYSVHGVRFVISQQGLPLITMRQWALELFVNDLIKTLKIHSLLVQINLILEVPIRRFSSGRSKRWQVWDRVQAWQTGRGCVFLQSCTKSTVKTSRY